MRILFFSQDIGPSRNLARIAVEAVDRGHAVESVFFFSASPLQVARGAKKFGVVVISPGTLHSDHDAEIIKKFKESGSKVAFFCDTYDVFLRESISKVAHLCDFVFVPDIFEKAKAVEAGFKNVVVSGVPLWEEFCKPTRYTGDDIRLALKIPRIAKTILFTGIKKSEITKRAFEDFLFALSGSVKNWMLFPRFRKEDELFEEGYYENVLRSRGFDFVDSHKLYQNTSDLLPGADLVVSLASTVGIEAVYHRKRVIDYLPDYFVERLKEIGGDGTWNPAEIGATCKAETKEKLSQAINHLFTREGFSELQKNQEKFYPMLQSGDSARIILETLENSVK